VLREADLERDAFVRTVFYITENPVRAELVAKAADWPYSGSLAVGYPDFDWRRVDFSERLWQIADLEMKRMG
jgi:hypothetical protein